MAHTKRKYKCPICDKHVNAMGITGHIRLAHQASWKEYKDQVEEVDPEGQPNRRASKDEGRSASVEKLKKKLRGVEVGMKYVEGEELERMKKLKQEIQDAIEFKRNHY